MDVAQARQILAEADPEDPVVKALVVLVGDALQRHDDEDARDDEHARAIVRQIGAG